MELPVSFSLGEAGVRFNQIGESHPLTFSMYCQYKKAWKESLNSNSDLVVIRSTSFSPVVLQEQIVLSPHFHSTVLCLSSEAVLSQAFQLPTQPNLPNKFKQKMKQSASCVLFVLASVAMILLEEQQVSSMAVAVSDMAQQCDPDVLQQVDSPKIRRICNFLQNYAVAMQQLNREGGGVLYPDGMMENGVKRQDVDHVFLRFGRRRR